MLEMGEETRFSAEPSSLDLRAGMLRMKDFHGDSSLEVQVAGRINHGRPTTADDLVEAIATDEHAPPQIQAAELRAPGGRLARGLHSSLRFAWPTRFVWPHPDGAPEPLSAARSRGFWTRSCAGISIIHD